MFETWRQKGLLPFEFFHWCDLDLVVLNHVASQMETGSIGSVESISKPMQLYRC